MQISSGQALQTSILHHCSILVADRASMPNVLLGALFLLSMLNEMQGPSAPLTCLQNDDHSTNLSTSSPMQKLGRVRQETRSDPDTLHLN